jgi:predicted enzyme related to lactoylglutathione lyase
MRSILFLCLACALAASAACGGTKSGPQTAATTPTTQPAVHVGLSIKHTSVFVDDQAKALTFYTEVLGFAKKDDVSNSGYRWLTVHAPADPNGTELQLALNSDPAAKAYQEAMYKQQQPALMLYTADVKADHDRITAKGAKIAMPPTEVMAGSVIAQVDDGCGNLIQLTQLAR